MLPKFHRRSTVPEIMDDFSLKGEELEEGLRYLEVINKYLGANKVLLSGIQKLLNNSYLSEIIKVNKKGERPLRLVDIGCGGGDGLRAIAQLARKEGLEMQLKGLDANENTIEYARKRSADYPEISFSKQDILDSGYTWEGVDILCCSHFLYHLTYEQQLTFMQKCFREGVKVILINDLQRHWLPYYLYQLGCFLFRAPQITKVDGCIAIQKGYRRKELEDLMSKAGFEHYSLHWRWAFRYQLIIYNPQQH